MSDIGSNKALEILSEVRVIVGKLEVHIEGNGGKGLLQRQEEMEGRQDAAEKWMGKRPIVCPATAKEVMKSIGRAVAIATAVLSLIMGFSLLANRRLIDPRLEKLQEQVLAVKDAVDKLNPE